MRVRWVRRNTPIALVPYVQTEAGLPTGQRALVFLPHSDDGRYIGASLYVMNRKGNGAPPNEVRLVVVASGHRSVSGEMSKEEKALVRKGEAVCWAETLGFRRDQVLFLDAEKTYEGRKGVHARDQARTNALVLDWKPTMVWVPHLSDTAQHINVYARRMALNAALGWLAQGHGAGEAHPRLWVVEYPTNHVPILPPSDKNFVMAFTDSIHAEIKHQANQAHVSQQLKYFDMMEKLVEAIDAVRESDDTLQIGLAGGRLASSLSGVRVNPRQSRGEHWGVTRLVVRTVGGAGPAIVEERVRFPLSPADQESWFAGGRAEPPARDSGKDAGG